MCFTDYVDISVQKITGEQNFFSIKYVNLFWGKKKKRLFPCHIKNNNFLKFPVKDFFGMHSYFMKTLINFDYAFEQ